MRILIVDDHPVMRFGVRQLIEQHWPQAAVSEAGNLRQALELARAECFDTAVFDLSLPDVSGLEGLAQLHRVAPGLPILVLSMHDEEAYARRAFQVGAKGYLAKENATAELIAAISRVRNGGRYVSATLAERLAGMLAGEGSSLAPHEMLSPQEYRVMLLIAAGKTASEIAGLMHLSAKTVGTYRTRIIEKTGLANTAEIARYCTKHGLLETN